MAFTFNTFRKPELIADTAIQVLKRELVLAPLVWTNGLGDFRGHRNDTINIRLRLPSTADEHDLRETVEADRKIVLRELDEITMPVQLTTRIEHATPISDEEMTLDIEDWNVQVAARQILAVAEQHETKLASLIENTSYTLTQSINENDPVTAFVKAQGDLNKARVPRDGRVIVVGADVETALLNSDQLRDASKAGDSNALRNGEIGRLRGNVPVVGSLFIDPGAAYVFHKTAFIAAHRAPVVPTGAVAGGSAAANGLAIRWIRDYDADYAIDRSIFTVYAGYSAVTENTTQGVTGPFKRGVKLTLGT